MININRFLNQIICGDCLEVLKTMPDNSVDSIVTDPPYGIEFMGKEWDSFSDNTNSALGKQSPANKNSNNKAFKTRGKPISGWCEKDRQAKYAFQDFCYEWAKECLRVLKPGGFLLAFGGTRTYHRMTCAIEDAGFEIRDCIQWIYGSGFPKSMDISKAIDKKAGAERKVIGQLKRNDRVLPSGQGGYHGRLHEQYQEKGRELIKLDITAPSTDEAKQWDGWGTALKPANEPIVVARKPLSEKTVADNVLKWGTGGINIDGCRVEYDMTDTNPATNPLYRKENGYKTNYGIDSNPSAYALKKEEGTMNINNQGRFPANVIFDEEAGRLLDEQSGISKSSGGKGEKSRGALGNSVYGKYENKELASNAGGLGDTGGASRFFYCAKASKAERRESKHPTVKPLNLMRYLVRLVTPPNGTALDPFAGSGTTLEAAMLEGFSFVGIERQAEYIPDIQARVKQAQVQQNLFG